MRNTSVCEVKQPRTVVSKRFLLFHEPFTYPTQYSSSDFSSDHIQHSLHWFETQHIDLKRETESVCANYSLSGNHIFLVCRDTWAVMISVMYSVRKWITIYVMLEELMSMQFEIFKLNFFCDIKSKLVQCIRTTLPSTMFFFFTFQMHFSMWIINEIFSNASFTDMSLCRPEPFKYSFICSFEIRFEMSA